jgi:proteasome accessory factor B
LYKQTPAERLVTLTCCLLSRPSLGLSKNELFQAVTAYAQAGTDAAREKMFDRDKNAIREAGFILEVIGNDGFEDTDSARYRIQNSSFSWPEDFELTPQMLQLLEIASKAWNNQVMGQSARSGIMRLRSLGLIPMSTDLAMLSPRLLAQHPAFAPLANAIAVGQMVSFNYRKADLTEQIREVSPQKLRQLAGEWVLLADEHGQIKNFLLRRIVSNVIDLTDLAQQVSEAEINQAEAELLIHVEKQVAKIEISPDTEAFWHFNPGPDSIVELNYMDEALLAEDLMEYGSDLLVLEPASLAERISESLLRVVKLHA